MCRQTEEEFGPTCTLPHHRHFVGFSNMPVQAPTRDQPFYGYSEKLPHFSCPLRRAWGYGGSILVVNPPKSLQENADKVLQLANIATTSAVKICRTIRHFLMNVRQKMLECPTKCLTDNKKKLVDEKKWNTNDHDKGQQLGFNLYHFAVFEGTYSTLIFRWSMFFL